MQNYITKIKTDGGQTAGVIYGDTLRIVKARHHFVRRYQGYGASAAHVKQAQAQGCKWVEFVDHNGETYRVRIPDFLAFGIPDDLGAGRQLFMSRRSMQWYMRRDAAVNLEADILQGRRERQMQLWGEGRK
jgi:hypothetical protein